MFSLKSFEFKIITIMKRKQSKPKQRTRSRDKLRKLDRSGSSARCQNQTTNTSVLRKLLDETGSVSGLQGQSTGLLSKKSIKRRIDYSPYVKEVSTIKKSATSKALEGPDWLLGGGSESCLNRGQGQESMQSFQNVSLLSSQHKQPSGNLGTNRMLSQEKIQIVRESPRQKPENQEVVSDRQQKPSFQPAYSKVYVMGDTKYGQLGFDAPKSLTEDSTDLDEKQANPSAVIELPKMCSYNILIKQIACGETHTHLLSQDGYIYSMGRNQHGVLGLGMEETSLNAVTQPQLVQSLQCIVQIATGKAHTIAIDVKRQAYGWGKSENGALGVRKACQHMPQTVDIGLKNNEQVIQIDCGLEHSCFLTADGDVYACGEGEFGQLGLGYVALKEFRPMKLAFKDLVAGDYVTKLSCGAFHSCFLTRFKHVFATGLNNIGQLGIGEEVPQINAPVLVESLSGKGIEEIACGESSFAVSNKGELYAWGLYNYQIYRKPFVPTSMTKPVSAVSQSFYGMTAAIDTDERAWFWDSQSQASNNLLALSTYPSLIKTMRHKRVKQVFAGRNLVFALGEDVHHNQAEPEKQRAQKVQNSRLELDGLQAIPEKDERPTVSSANNQQMPHLDLARITSPENASEMAPVNYSDTDSSCSPHKENVSPINVSHVAIKVKSKDAKQGVKRITSNKRKRSHDDATATSKSNKRSRSNARSSSKAKLSKTSCIHQKSQSFKVKENMKPTSSKSKHAASKSDEEKSRKKSRSRSKSAGRTKTKSSTTKQKNTQPSPVSNERHGPNLKRHEADEKQHGGSQANQKCNNERRENQTKHKTSNSGQIVGNKQPLSNQDLQAPASQKVTLKPHQKNALIFNDTISEEQDSKSASNGTHRELCTSMQGSMLQSQLQKGEVVHTQNSAKPDALAVQSLQLRQQDQSETIAQDLVLKQDRIVTELEDELKKTMLENNRLRQELENAWKVAADNSQRCEDLRQSQIKQSTASDGTIRKLESQMRIANIEKRDLEIKLESAERKLRDLDDRVNHMSLSKNKEAEYLNSLGKSGQALRMEKLKTKELQHQIEMIQKAMAIMETSYDAVKKDKELLIQENHRLRMGTDSKSISSTPVGACKKVALKKAASPALNSRLVTSSDKRPQSATSTKQRRSVKVGSNNSKQNSTSQKSQSRSRKTRSRSKSHSNNSRSPNCNSVNSNNEYALPRARSKSPNCVANLDFLKSGSNTRVPAQIHTQTVAAYQDQHILAKPIVSDKPAPKNDFTTRESRETGRFNENHSPCGFNQTEQQRGIVVYGSMEPEARSKSSDEKFLCGSSKRNVVKLLEEARKLQVKHQRLMSRSKGRSSDFASGSPLRASAGSGLKSPARNHPTNIMRVKQPLRDRSEESRSNEKRKHNYKRPKESPMKKEPVHIPRTPPHQLSNVLQGSISNVGNDNSRSPSRNQSDREHLAPKLLPNNSHREIKSFIQPSSVLETNPTPKSNFTYTRKDDKRDQSKEREVHNVRHDPIQDSIDAEPKSMVEQYRNKMQAVPKRQFDKPQTPPLVTLEESKPVNEDPPHYQVQEYDEPRPKPQQSIPYEHERPQDPSFQSKIRAAQERYNPHHSPLRDRSPDREQQQPNSLQLRQSRSSTIPKNDNSDYLNHVKQLNKSRPEDRFDRKAPSQSPEKETASRDYRNNKEDQAQREQEYNKKLLANLDKLASRNHYGRLPNEYEDPTRQRLDKHVSRHDFDDTYSDGVNPNLARSHSVGHNNQGLTGSVMDDRSNPGGRARSHSKNATFSDRLKVAQKKSGKNSLASRSPERNDTDLLNSMFNSNKAQRRQDKEEKEKQQEKNNYNSFLAKREALQARLKNL